MTGGDVVLVGLLVTSGYMNILAAVVLTAVFQREMTREPCQHTTRL